MAKAIRCSACVPMFVHHALMTSVSYKYSIEKSVQLNWMHGLSVRDI